jgi:hypothetical protein
VGHATLEKVSPFDRVLFLKGRPQVIPDWVY